MSADVKVVGVDEVQRMLNPWKLDKLSSRLNKAAKAGANELKPDLKAAARPISRRMARSVYVHRAKRGEKPAWVLGHRRSRAYFWHFQVGGTRTHGPKEARFLQFKGRNGRTVRTARVKGIQANPIVDRVARQGAERAFRVAMDTIERTE